MASMCSSVLLLCVLHCAASFNLEPRIPVIKLGKPGSYFGFSVAEHLTISGHTNTSWLLVGAPLDKNLQPNTTKSGALWKCSLSTALRDCQQVITDGKRTVDGNHLMAPQKDEIKEDQWLGVSVRSQGPGKRAVVCAHRYIWKQGETQNGQGLCYTLSNELDMQDLWMPCKGQRIDREHEEFGFCQAGISSMLLEDNTLLLGSPGSYTWRGTMFSLDTVEDILTRDHTVYLAPVEDRASPVEKYSYLGMSVVGARFFSSNFSYAAGAPRARGTGQVVMFQKRQSDWASADIYLLNFTLIFNGEQFGSSFGYEVASADVNGDGLPDLLIGAPFYFSRDVGGAVYLYLNKNYNLKTKYNLRLTGKPESQFGISIANAGDLNKDGCEDVAIGSPYEGNGVVYIHFGNRKKGLHTKPDQVITAESLPNIGPVVMKTFGYSLSGGLDLDANGYPDLLVGAYESSRVVLIRTRPIIDIMTSIEPSNTIINIDPTKHGCEKNRSSEHTCFSFKACCNIKSLIKSTNSYTNVHYEIEAETFPGGRKYSRVFFDDEKTEIAKTINVKTNEMNCEEHIVYLRNNTRDIQTPIKFQLTYTLVHAKPQYYSSGALPNIDDYPVLNATARTTFSANFLNDCGNDGVCISDLVLDAVLDLPKMNSIYALTLGKQDEIRLEVSATNLGESAYEAQLFVQHHSSLHYVAAEIKDKHVICTSVNKTVVSCLLENPFTRQPNGSEPIILRFDPRGLDDNEPSLIFTVWANSTSKELHPGKIPLQLEATVIKNADLLIKGAARPEQVFYGGDVKGESAMKYFDDIGTRVVHTYQVINKGHWRVHSARVVISWPYQVASDNAQGKWLLYPEDLPTVDEESDQSNGECFLISGSEINPLKLTPRPGVSEPLPAANLEMEHFLPIGKLSVSSNEKQYNETKGMEYSSASDNRVRRKRDNDIIKAEAYTDKDGQRKHVVNMSCQNKTAKCIQFQCLIYRLGRMQTTTISVRARLWNSTLVEDYPRVSHVNIASTAYIHIPEHYNTTGVVDATKVETVAYPDLKFAEPTEVPYWVIIVSVIVGLIVLILLIIALWKLGFFKRSRPDPTLSGNLEKNNHESSPFIGRDRSIR